MAGRKKDKANGSKGTRRHIIRGTTTALVAISLLTGFAFDGPGDITDEQQLPNYRQAPIVMDIDDFVNAPVEDDEDEADEQKAVKMGFFARFRQAVLTMPLSLRVLVVVPLWAVGTALMTAVSFLWSILFASPLGAFIASVALGLAVLLGLFTATAKMLFPELPIRKILSKQNLMILGITAFILSGIDAFAPMYWNKYPLAAAAIKLFFGGAVIGILSYRTKSLFSKIKGGVMPQLQ